MDEGGSEESSSSSSGGGSDNESPPNFPASSAARQAPAPVSFNSAGEGETDARLAKVAEYVKDVQAPCRAYVAGWSLLQAGIAGYFGYDATKRQHERATRTYDIMNATVSGLNAILTLIKPMPACKAWSRFKKMPESTLAEKRAKIDFGVRALGAQIAADRYNSRPEEHVVAALVGLGFGAGILFGYDHDNIRPAVQATLGVILLAELQFATRPHRVKRYNRELALMGTAPQPASVELSFAPLITRTGQGLSLVGRF